MDLKYKKRGPKKPVSIDVAGQLPGFRASSELPDKSTIAAPKTIPVNTVNQQDGLVGTAASNTITDEDLSAAFTDDDDETLDPTNLTLDRDTPKNDSFSDKPEIFDPKPKKKYNKKYFYILLGLLGVVVLGSAGWYLYQKNTDKKNSSQPTTVVPKIDKKKSTEPETKPSPITGVDVPSDIALRPTTAIMIENSVDARPQSGLYDADMVVEAVAEGGITRFVALFQSGQPKEIGPIRSARPYYVQIAKTFDAAFVHAGGSPDSLALINDIGVKDMSAFEENGTYIRSDKRAAPHNLYSSMSKLDTRRNDLGFKSSTFTPYSHKNDTPQTPTASTINFTISSEDFNPTFSYVASSNNYRRSEGGAAHIDAANEAGQLSPKVIIGLITTKGTQDQYSTYRLTGTGDIVVFQDGIMSEGTWTKDKDDSQFVFKDKNGLPMNFNKGQIWMTLLGSTSNISYTP
jgi:hypothetical protein